MDKSKKVFGIGITGLIGSRITELLEGKHAFDNLSLDTGVDITTPATLSVIETDSHHDTVLLLAAKADVDGCETDKHLDKVGAAWKINVEGTQNVVNASKKGKKKIIYVSTDFVFDGEDAPSAGYTEEDKPKPINWYGETKWRGEEIVRNSGLPYIILRLAYPYRTPFAAKKDFVQAILGRLKEGQPITAVVDHIMTPTFVDDIALALDMLLTHNSVGIYHVVGSQFMSPYDASQMIAREWGLDRSLIQKTTREEYFKGRAVRPFNLSLNNDRIEKLGLQMKTFEEGLVALKAQIGNQ